MSALKLHTLKRKIVVIFLMSAILRLILGFFLPKMIYANIAPDEGIYSFLAKWIGESKPIDQFPAFGDDIYNQSKAFIIPASCLFRLGFSELDSIRVVSSIYGLGSLFIVGIFALKYLGMDKTSRMKEYC